MSLATLVNSFLGNQMQNRLQPPDQIPAAAVPIPAAKKAYNDRGYIHHEGYEGHPLQSFIHHYDKVGHYGKKKSRSVALSALTLLAFLFFLHILQQCIQDHQTQDYHRSSTMAPPQVVIRLKAAREAEKRVGDEAADGVEGETARPRQEAKVFTEGGDLYQYAKVHHVPVKMTMVERYNKKP